jgi:hypothetical protein
VVAIATDWMRAMPTTLRRVAPTARRVESDRRWM